MKNAIIPAAEGLSLFWDAGRGKSLPVPKHLRGAEGGARSFECGDMSEESGVQVQTLRPGPQRLIVVAAAAPRIGVVLSVGGVELYGFCVFLHICVWEKRLGGISMYIYL